jgi:hypothetical protein
VFLACRRKPPSAFRPFGALARALLQQCSTNRKMLEDIVTMIAEVPRPLPEHLNMPCYACAKETSTHLCRFKMGELLVQICLCDECMQMDTGRLLKHTVGIQDSVPPASVALQTVCLSDRKK